ncbi:unnamed protein product (macronuclear) [Paramecium tetraurelia]|uniref:C2H2-type domain-containing protein n=1 Tax=Paramecium tetraurelia TaxID=5888 RepID=A0CJA0_PARTE|nr:uncharacterized protein GSPATT00000577001 [Paramecium tetraurelia]CAK70867.1 unnamed protein product [Paramecium tetraurelia]|eukprot:XP_001438264.1 hypothetical protein (macronuclear) [Paramecium tetraurelia strain d4-2]
MTQLRFLLSNAKISSQQFSQIKEILKLNFKVIYKDDLINNNKLFNDSLEKQELVGEDIFFMNSNVSNYFEDNIGNQACNLSTFQEKTENPNESFHSSHSEFFDYISQIDHQIQDSSVIVKKEIFTISELLQNLSFKEEYSSRSPKLLDMNHSNNKINCQMCKKQFKNTKTLKKHQKNIHKHTIMISSNLKQQETQPEAAF